MHGNSCDQDVQLREQVPVNARSPKSVERMRVYGVDFTSRPSRRKPITCLECVLEGGRLTTVHLSAWTSFAGFEALLCGPGPWIAGIDFPFGQARRFIEAIGWPQTWHGYVGKAEALGRDGFRAVLDHYRARQPSGDKEHRRATDVVAGAISPQKLYGTPVGLMFFEGAPRLRAAGVTIPVLQEGDAGRVVVEAYPGVLARAMIGRRSYKQDTKAKQTVEQAAARQELLLQITDGAIRPLCGFDVNAPVDLTDDPGGDHLDAWLCAIQAGWAWTRRNSGFGLPSGTDPLEGWIADPTMTGSVAENR